MSLAVRAAKGQRRRTTIEDKGGYCLEPVQDGPVDPLWNLHKHTAPHFDEGRSCLV